MGAIQDSAELAIRNLFKNSRRQDPGPRGAPRNRPHGRPGPRIELHRDPSAPPRDPPSSTFRGRGPQVHGNWNRTPEANLPARRLMYVPPLHGGLGHPPSTTHGCIRPVTPRRPSALTPAAPAATQPCARGMCWTSQRIVDVIFHAFGACAASQGCMNNLTFGLDDGEGDDGFGYYETFAGGSGAGPSWHGTSGVHTHMTNTRITDPESPRATVPTPFMLHRFCLRGGSSAGRGRFRGGEGVRPRHSGLGWPMSASILSERRGG
jgi:5-oxoprolinase (ATP-hydrolysing)